MTNFKRLILLLIFGIIISFGRAEVGSYQVVGNDTLKIVLTHDETILFNLINDLRVQNKMPVLPLSEKLCFVAHTHIDDLIKSKPFENGCGLNSWSENANWTACCHVKDPSGINCMKSKPKELTGYPGNGFELVYAADDKAVPTEAADLWKQVDASADMILNKGRWKDYQWKVMGVGIKEGYALLWFGDKSENSYITKAVPLSSTPAQSATNNPSGTKLNSSEKGVSPVSEQTNEVTTKTQKAKPGNYYLIVASLKTNELAQSELKQVQHKGYPKAIILEADGVFRIAINTFDSENSARKIQNRLKNEFPGIWILKGKK